MKISLRYMGSFFIIDAISAVPLLTYCNLFLDYDIYYIFKIIKLFKGLKIPSLKFGKLYSLYLGNNFDINLSDNLKSFIKSAIAFYTIVHVLTCVWIYFSKYSLNNNWIIHDIDKQSSFKIYISSYYYNLTTLFTVGYGDIHSYSMEERTYNLVLLVFGLIINTYTISFLSNLITSQDDIKMKYHNKILCLNEIKQEYDINNKVYLKIKRYIRYLIFNNNRDKKAFIFELPGNVKNQLICNMYRDMIANFVFFKNSHNQDFNAKILLALRPIKAYKNEKVIKQDNIVEEIVIVRAGHLSLIFKCHGVNLLNVKNEMPNCIQSKHRTIKQTTLVEIVHHLIVIR